MILSHFRRLAHKLRARLLWPTEVRLKETTTRLRLDMAQAEARLQQENEYLRERLDHLELLLTEHPDVPARDAEAGTKFPSPAVSIVMPTWNRARALEAAIRSVQAQVFRDWELLVIDDGSTDDTAEVLAALAVDSRIRYVRRSHIGHSAARNHALEIARGALVAYLDSDNLWSPIFWPRRLPFSPAKPTVPACTAHWYPTRTPLRGNESSSNASTQRACSQRITSTSTFSCTEGVWLQAWVASTRP